MFRQSIQPSTVSLLSSVGSSPFHGLWTMNTDAKLPEDSFIVVMNDSLMSPEVHNEARKPITLPNECDGGPGKQLDCPVIHIQSPTIRSTYILAPQTGELSLNHTWLHLQVRNLHKEFAFEVGVVDSANRRGRLRWSTFQRVAAIYHNPAASNQSHVSMLGSLLHFPLTFSSPDSFKLTEWCTLDVNVAACLRSFASIAADVPSTAVALSTFTSISYIKIYANCRVRRLWVSQGTQHRGSNQSGWPAEFQLYGE